MPDESAAKTMTEATAAILQAVPIYQDALQPAARQIGTALDTAGAFACLALRPLRTTNLAGNLLFDRLDDWLRERLGGVPPEKITAPRAQIAGQLLMFLPLVEEENILRTMYIELLANAMLVERRSRVHPAYTEIIRQLSPAEAALLGEVWRRRSGIATLMYTRPARPGLYYHYTLFDLGDLDSLEALEEREIQVNNFCRLQLLETSVPIAFYQHPRHDALRSSRAVRVLEATAAADGVELSMAGQGMASLTPFGHQFIELTLPKLEEEYEDNRPEESRES